MKKGISLITLIITIVVIIILSAAVLLTLGNTSVIDNARIASLATDYNNLQTSIELYCTNVATSNLDVDYDKQTILFGEIDDSFRIIQKTGEDLVSVTINKDNEEILVYKLDKEICNSKGIEFPEPPSFQSAWYINENGQVYLVYEEEAIISAWIIGNPPEGKQIENDVLDKFVAKIGEWEKEPDIIELIPVADANMFEYTIVTNGTVQIKCFNSEYEGTIPTEIKFPTIDPDGNNIIGIYQNAFYENPYLKKVIIPEGYTTIGNKAFFSCELLEEVYIASTVNSIQYNANSPFDLCEKITKITIPQTLIKDSSTNPNLIFDDSKSSLKEVKFIGEITTIPYNAFNGFTALESITIPDTVTSIGANAFNGCTSISGKIIIPKNVASIANNAFQNCTNITEIEFLSEGALQTIGSYAFSNVGSITSVKIPEGVTDIGSNTFENCLSIKEVYLPSTLQTIKRVGNSPFRYCDKIEKISIPDYVAKTVSYTPYDVFGDSKNTIKKVDFVGEITAIGANAFNGFTALESIIIPDAVTSIGASAFNGCTSISGKVIIPKNVTSIANNAFQNCTNITEIEFLSEGALQTIGNYAFSNVGSITSVKIPEGVTDIGSNTFENCLSIKEVYLPSTLQTMKRAGYSPFRYCDKIEKISIPDYVAKTVSYTPYDVFGDSKSTIKEVAFVGEITAIGANAFNGFTALQSIKIPDTVTSIVSNSFTGCTNLTKIIYSGTATGSPWGATNATVVAQ